MIRKIRYFQALVRSNSFSETAEECYISQSAISQQVKALERGLGFELQDRKKRRLTLTLAGEYFYKKNLVWCPTLNRSAGKPPNFQIREETF